MEKVTATLILGRKEWVSLPDLGLLAIKAKVDTGAKTSALHASAIEIIGPASAPRVRFSVHPIPMRSRLALTCEADVVDEREVMSSNGATERRTIIRTTIRIGSRNWIIEIGLTNRLAMTHRMLLGRQAIPADMLVDPAATYLQPHLSASLYVKPKR